MHQITQPIVPTTEGTAFPVRRIFCIGKNYADHTKEMGGDPKTTPPVFFTKPADAACTDEVVPFPLATDNLHYEGELVVALKSGGTMLTEDSARATVYGYACGCDLTRRDLQNEAKERRAPWDLAKALDRGAMIGPILPREDAMDQGRLALKLNGEVRQSGDLADMIWPIPAIIAKLSQYFELKPGDLIFTGTPAGVGEAKPGDTIEVTIADLPPLRFSFAP